MAKKRIIKKVKKENPVVFTGKMLRDLSEDKDFTLAKFKKRYNLEI